MVMFFKEAYLENPLALSKEESAVMKKFWATNEWARKQFSKNMTFAWKKVKEEQSIVYEVQTAPKGFIRKVIDWARRNGEEIDDSMFIGRYDPNNNENNFINPNLNKYTRGYVDAHDGESSRMANAFFLALLNTNREISKMDLSKVDQETRILCKALQQEIKESLFVHPDKPFEVNAFRVLDSDEVQAVYSILRNACYDSFNTKLAGIFERNLNKAYDYIAKNWQVGKPIRMNPYGMDL